MSKLLVRKELHAQQLNPFVGLILEEDIKEKKNDELKKELKNRGLSVKGKNADFVARL